MNESVYAALLSPRSVALVGASDNARKPTGRPLRFLRQHGWAGEVYAVNPVRATVQGEPAWDSLRDLPSVPDHVLILTAADAAVDAVRESAEVGAGVATVVADGFLPGTLDGDRRRAQLREIVDGSALRLLGPSSLGVANPIRRLALTGNAAFAEPTLPAGDVFVASQSGSALGALLSRGAEMGLGFAGMVSVGNEFDLTLGEICRAAVDDPQVASFALFLENLSASNDLAAFARAAAQRGKPVVAYKLGRSEEAARLAQSHTGALAGDDALADAFFAAHGIARVTGFEALLEAQSLARLVAPRQRIAPARVAVVSTTGGGGAMAVDCLAAAGLAITGPGEATRAKLAEVGIASSGGGLIDLTLTGTTYDTIKAALDILLAGAEFDAVVAVPGSSARFSPEVSVAPIIDSAGAVTPLAVFVVPSAPQALRLLRQKGLPAYRTAESLADAMSAVFARSAIRPAAVVVPVPPGAAARALDEHSSYRVLESVGIASPASVVVPVDALPAQLPVPSPAAVKVLSAALAHKSDVGGVVLGVHDAAQLRIAVSAIRDSVAVSRPELVVDRVLVQQMGRGLAEALIGFRRDPDVGPVVLLAAGGVLAEIYRDRSVRLAPVSLDQAREMVSEVRGLRLAAGYRGAPRGDLEALARAVVGMSLLASSEDPVVIEAEANPVLVLAEGEGVLAVDAVCVVAGSGRS